MDDLAILVLYLPDRYERMKSILNELERMNLIHKTEFIQGQRIISHGTGTAGVADGHLRCLEYAMSKNYKNVLILEDDCKFLVSPQLFRYEVESFLENATDWDAAWIGSFVRYYQHDIQHNFVRLSIFNQDTATLVNSRYYSKLIEYYRTCRDRYIATGDEKYNIDAFMNTETDGIFPLRDDKLYTLTTRICGQADCFSDRTGCVMNGGVGIPI